jgi:hypothetical protein
MRGVLLPPAAGDPGLPGVSTLRCAAPSSTLRARAAKSSEHLDSFAFSAAGLQLTTSSVLLLPPRESSSRRVSCNAGGSKHESNSAIHSHACVHTLQKPGEGC